MSAGQAWHVDGTVRMAFDDDGNILAADIDFAQDVGAYPTPYPVLTTAAIGMFFPGPYRVPKASFSYKTVFSNTRGLAAYRGPWQYETLTREILLDIAARKMGMDPVELRRRNILRGDEMPYVNPNGMPYDHVAPADTFEQAVKILDHEGFRTEQREALGRRAAISAWAFPRTSSRPAPRPATLPPRARRCGWNRPARSTST